MDNKRRVETGELTFQVDAGLLFELGERLVTRPSVALAELIKNSYDADATEATVLLENVSKRTSSLPGTIIVQDNGVGMTFEEVHDFWMRIATPAKRNEPVSRKYRRPRTGAKGIGRFAARRLADVLTMLSVAETCTGVLEEIRITFDWRKDFQPGETLTKIPVIYERRTASPDTPTGVILMLEHVRDVWSENDISALKRDLLTLQSPFPNTMTEIGVAEDRQIIDPGFSVTIEAPEFPSVGGELREYFLQAAWAVLTGRVDHNGVAHYRLDIRKPKETVEYIERETQFPEIAGATFKIHYFIYRTDLMHDFDFGVREARQYGRERAGVRVYLNGFRVYGYGERGDDWLHLDEMRAERERRPPDLTDALRVELETAPGEPFLRLPGNNQLFGAIFLTQSTESADRSTGLQITINRQRLVDNSAYRQLVRFVRVGIYFMTLQYYRVRLAEEHRETRKRSDTTQLRLFEGVREPLGEIRRVIDASDGLSSQEKATVTAATAEVLGRVEQHDAVVEQLERQRISEMSMLRVLASTGTMVSFLNHQLRAITGDLANAAGLFQLYAEHVDASVRPKYDRNVEKLWQWHRFVQQQVDHLSFLLGSRARSEQRPYNLKKAVQDVFAALEGYAEDYGILLLNTTPDNLMSPPMYLAEIHAILVNLTTNSLKAVRDQSARQVLVTGHYEGTEVHVSMLDTGRGLDIDPPERAFEPFVTTSSPDLVLGEGTGLGLYMVRTLLAEYGGFARFVEAPEGWSTCVELVLPKA